MYARSHFSLPRIVSVYKLMQFASILRRKMMCYCCLDGHKKVHIIYGASQRGGTKEWSRKMAALHTLNADLFSCCSSVFVFIISFYFVFHYFTDVHSTFALLNSYTGWILASAILRLNRLNSRRRRVWHSVTTSGPEDAATRLSLLRQPSSAHLALVWVCLEGQYNFKIKENYHISHELLACTSCSNVGATSCPRR